MVPTVLALGSSRLDAQQPCAWSMMICQKLATALATLILLTPVLLFAVLDCQSEAWKHASPLTMQSITDAGGSI